MLQSIELGAAIGLLLDNMGALILRDERHNRFVLDAVSGGVTALLVFFGSLVILDGQLHPLLIFGSFLGMAVEHLLVGRWVKKWLVRVRRWWCKVCCSLPVKLTNMAQIIHFRSKTAKNKGKTSKKPPFFSKST